MASFARKSMKLAERTYCVRSDLFATCSHVLTRRCTGRQFHCAPSPPVSLGVGRHEAGQARGLRLQGQSTAPCGARPARTPRSGDGVDPRHPRISRATTGNAASTVLGGPSPGTEPQVRQGRCRPSSQWQALSPLGGAEPLQGQAAQPGMAADAVTRAAEFPRWTSRSRGGPRSSHAGDKRHAV